MSYVEDMERHNWQSVHGEAFSDTCGVEDCEVCGETDETEDADDERDP